MPKSFSIFFSILILTSSLAGCTEDVKEIGEDIKDIGDEILENVPFISKSLCFLSTVYDASVDGYVSRNIVPESGTIDFINEYGAQLELEVPSHGALVNHTSDIAKQLAYTGLSVHPAGKAAALSIKGIELVGGRACAIFGDEVDNEAWSNYTYLLASMDNEQFGDFAFKAAAQFVSTSEQGVSNNQENIQLELNFIANMSDECRESCGFDDRSILFEEEIGLTSAFGVTRDSAFALDGDLETYAYSSAFLCPNLHTAELDDCISHGSSILQIPGEYQEDDNVDVTYRSLQVCPGEDSENCSRESVAIDLYFCNSALECSSPISVDTCDNCSETYLVEQDSNWMVYVLRIADTHPDNAVDLKVFECSQNQE